VKSLTIYAVVDGALLTCFLISLFSLPPDTHFVPVAIGVTIFFAAMNYALFRRLRKPADTHPELKFGFARVMAITLILVDLVFSAAFHMNTKVPLAALFLICLGIALSAIFDPRRSS
jgi:hypothetical protein